MSKDLLALLALIVPTLILFVAVAFALGQSSEPKVEEGQDTSISAKPRAATQKRMRDPWEKPVYAKTANRTSNAPAAQQCDRKKIERDGRCLYW